MADRERDSGALLIVEDHEDTRVTLRDYLEDQIERQCNAKVARYQTIKKFEVLPEEFSVEGGELTATMKLRRSVITDKYAAVIDGFYADGAG